MVMDVRVSQLKAGDVLVATKRTVVLVGKSIDPRKRYVETYRRGEAVIGSAWRASTTLRVGRQEGQ